MRLWAAILGQDEGHVEVHIGHHQGHVGAEIKVMLGQDEGQYGPGPSSWVKMKVIAGSTLASIRVMLGQDEGQHGCGNPIKNHPGSR